MFLFIKIVARLIKQWSAYVDALGHPMYPEDILNALTFIMHNAYAKRYNWNCDRAQIPKLHSCISTVSRLSTKALNTSFVDLEMLKIQCQLTRSVASHAFPADACDSKVEKIYVCCGVLDQETTSLKAKHFIVHQINP